MSALENYLNDMKRCSTSLRAGGEVARVTLSPKLQVGCSDLGMRQSRGTPRMKMATLKKVHTHTHTHHTWLHCQERASDALGRPAKAGRARFD